ncbi:MAG: hypothetical protein QE290_19150 [Acidovorax sp.]|uniref:hypothetical protein n=1 Tax=Acidovorax sp. TaxID=1872122 RepID=UPI0026241101|nr:hypothetical protein [Acidovorax sp.]MDH4466150.1 hypothetical protein [Acidovorax sp.]
MAARIVAFNDRGRAIGSAHHNAKLEDSDIDLIFALREEGLSLSKIAGKFDVGKACIWKVVHGHTRAETPVEWRRAGKPRSSVQQTTVAPVVTPPGEVGPGALLQRHLAEAWR